MIRCVAIDDEPLALKQIADYISRTPFLELVGTYENAMQAIDEMRSVSVDLMFVDINMPNLSGIDFVKSLERPPMIIFVTAYSEYAIEGFKVDAIDYILKPIGYSDFLKSAMKARSLHETLMTRSPKDKDEKDCLFVKSDYKIIRVSFDDIIYIEGMREYVRIHLVNAKPIMPLFSLRQLEEQLPSNKFMRVHRSYIVNLTKITAIDHSRILFDNKEYIPVGEQYKEAFQNYITSRSLG